MSEIFSRSFSLHSPIPPLPSPLNLPLPSPFPGHLLQFYQQEHKSTMCQASLIPCGLEVTRSSKQNSGMGARQSRVETPTPPLNWVHDVDSPGESFNLCQPRSLLLSRSGLKVLPCRAAVTHVHGDRCTPCSTGWHAGTACWMPALSLPCCSHEYSSAVWLPYWCLTYKGGLP